MADFDSPWKEALDLYFQAFLAFFFPRIHDDIDWSRGFESLDKELQQIAPQSAHGRRYVDKLVKVWRKQGRAVWVLIHVEVQTQRQRGFARPQLPGGTQNAILDDARAICDREGYAPRARKTASQEVWRRGSQSAAGD